MMKKACSLLALSVIFMHVLFVVSNYNFLDERRLANNDFVSRNERRKEFWRFYSAKLPKLSKVALKVSI